MNTRIKARPKELKVKPHPRGQDINQAQPPVKTMKGIGNGQERKHGFGRGGVMDLPKWMMKDPSLVAERLQEIRQRQAGQHAKSRQGKQELARAGIEQLFKGEGMTQDESEQVEALLETWHSYEARYRPALGAPRVSPSCRGHDAGDVHDTGDDRDARLERVTAEAVGACIDTLHYLERAAIGVHFRNKYVGVSVHRNPRIEDQHKAYQAAKEKLWPMLKRRGMVK
ncbi:hypothetical protein [Pusillimonas sp. NJUB218]|uniref:hypothetical protein n=1 Tax=Pusillimonas sp. NJUB218 TaxID=2023230 RepID=UPI000F4C09AD|nr:hypothetical protein [Pusillimonas sp. NJUB218]ROT45021.1 hypothetical protein CHR62_09220 [Pusillimonas sp. NJUB218]